MQYLGGKARIAKRIMDVILQETENRQSWVEPFVGGAWVLERAFPHFERVQAGDIVEDVILLYEHVGNGGALPETISKDRYKELKTMEPSPERGLAGFGCSFGGKWFAGYCGDRFNGKRTYLEIAKGNLIRRQEVFARTEFKVQDYTGWEINPGDVVYCDPPYEGTTEYGAASGFDSVEFWDWCFTQKEKGAEVFVSEFQAPEGVTEVWSRTAKTTLAKSENREVTERLFRV